MATALTALLLAALFGSTSCIARGGNPELLSVVLFTNRPGAWDVALYSLAGQTSDKYELIVVDDARAQRREAAVALSRRLGVQLQHAVSSKRKTSAQSTRYGEANAINTGIALARGDAVVLLNDYTWLPPNFVADTLAFFQRHPGSLLAFPYDAYAPCVLSAPRPEEEKALAAAGQGLACRDGGDVDVSQAYNVSALTIFKHPLDMAPSAKGWFCFERNFPHLRAVDKLSAPGQRERVAKPLPYSEGKLAEAFWDGPVFAVSMCVAEALNGIDEILDLGNGCAYTCLLATSMTKLLNLHLWSDPLLRDRMRHTKHSRVLV